MKTLVAYYSRGGTTKDSAELIQGITGGDLYEIKGTKKYGNYFKAIGIARKEFTSGELPEVVGKVRYFKSYDRILVGFPIWYSKAPQLVISFLKGYNLEGKDVYPFCTSGMSGPEEAVKQLKKEFPDAIVHDGIRVNHVDKKAVHKWLGDQQETKA